MMAAQNTSPNPLSAPSTVQATDMLDLMMRLADLLSHETDLVRAGRVIDIGPLQNEKTRLTRLYEKTIKELTAGGMKIESLSAPFRAQLVAASVRLSQTVTENERTLRIGRAATRRVLDMVVESVRLKQQPLTRYTARLEPARHRPLLALALDQRL